MRPNIFVALSRFGEFGDGPLRLLKKSGAEFYLNPTGKRLVADQLVEMAKESHGIIAGVEPYDTFVLANLPNLRCISRCGVGTDNIDLGQTQKRGIQVFNTPEVVVAPTAELAIGFIFDLLRNISVHNDLMHQRHWEKIGGQLLSTRTVGVIGLGRIGKRVAELLGGLGAQVLGCDLKPDRSWARKFRVKVVSLAQLLKKVDVITIHVNDSCERPFKLNAVDIAAMKKGVYLVNVARGHYVDEDALYDALVSGHIRGAALDVFVGEPYDGKLCELKNCILSPHVATLTVESRRQMEMEATQNLLAFLKKAKGKIFSTSLGTVHG